MGPSTGHVHVFVLTKNRFRQHLPCLICWDKLFPSSSWQSCARDIAQATLGRLSTTRHLYSLEISSCVAYVIGVRRDTTILSPTDALFRYTASVTPPLERMDAAAPHTHWDGQNSRVAPTKKISLPKVEFSGAHWYAQLYQKIIIIFADREPT